MAKKRRLKEQGKGKFEALKYVKQLEKKMGPKEDDTKKDERPPKKEMEEDQEILDLIKEAENELLTLKEKVDTKKLDRILKDASDALTAGDSRGAKELVDKLKEEIDKVVENHIEKRFFDAEMLIIELEVVGIDIASSKDIVADGKKALKEKRLKTALELAEKAASEVEKLQRQQVMEVMTYANTILDSLKALQVEAKDFEDKIEEATSELEKKHFEKAMEMAIMLEGELSSYRNEQFDVMVEKTRSVIQGKEDEGRDVAEAERMLKRALHAIDMKDFEGASDYLIEARYAADKEAGLEFKARAGQRKAKERFDELKNEGIFSAAAQDHIGKALKALRSKDFNKALMEAKKAEAAMGIAVREHERIMRRISSVNNNKMMAIDLGCDLAESEALLKQARGALEAGEFDLALDFVTQANEEIHLAMVVKAETEKEALMEGAGSLKDTRAEGQLNEAISLVKKGKSDKGFALINKVKSRLSGTMEKITQLKDGIAKIQTTLEDMAVKGVDITDAMDLIENVQEAMTSGNFVKARSEFYHCEKIVSQLTADLVYDTLRRIEEDLGAFDSLGLSLPGAYERLDDTWADLLRGEKQKATESTSDLNETLRSRKEEYLSTMEAIQMAQTKMHKASLMGIDVGGATASLTKAFESIEAVDFPRGKEIANQTLEELVALEAEAVEEIEKSTRIKMEDMESNFPIPMARDRLNRARALLEVGAYFNAFTELSQASRKIEDLSTRLQNLDTEFETVRSLLDQGEAMDIDIGAFRNLLEEAEANKETGHLEMSLSLLEQVKEDLKEIFGTRIAERMRMVSKLIPECEECNIDVEGSRMAIKTAEELIASSDFQNAFVKLTEVHKELVGQKEQYEEAADAVRLFTTNLERAEDLGLESKDLREKLGKATGALETGHFEEALDLAVEGDTDLSSKMSELVDTKLEENLNVWIERARSFEAETGEIERFKELALAEKEDGNFEGALENLKKGVEKAKGAISVVLEARIDGLADSINQAREDNIQLGNLGGLLTRSSDALQKHAFDEVVRLLGDLDKGLSERRDRHEKALTALEECENLIGTIADEGVNVRTAVETLDTAKGSLESGEYDLAMDLIAQSKEIIEELKDGYEKAKMAIDETLTLIEELAELDIETISLTEETTKVYDFIDAGDYSEARSTALDIRERAEDIRKEHFEKRIGELNEIVWELSSRGEDVIEIKRLLDSIDSAFKGREFEGLSERIAKGHIMVAEVMERFALETEKVEAIENDLRTFEERGIIILEARNLLKDAKDKLEARDYKEIDGLLDRAREAADKAEGQKGEATEAISRCLEAIDVPFEDIDISHLASMSSEAQGKFDAGHYEEARVLANNSVKEAHRLQTEYVSLHLSECEKLIEDASAEGVNTTPVAEMIGQTGEMLNDGEFESANALTLRIKETIEGLRKAHASAKERLTTLEEMVEEAKAITIEVEAAQELIGDVNEAFTIPDYEAATDLAQQGIDTLAAEREELFTTLVAAIEGAIANAKENGVPAIRAEELLLEGQGMLDNGQYLDAYRILNESQDTLKSVTESFEELSGRLKALNAGKTEAADHGVAIAPVDEVLKKVEEALIEARFKDAEKHLGKAEEALRAGWRRTVEVRIDETKVEVKNIEDLGIQTVDIHDIMEGAKAALEVNEFPEVFTICSTVMDMVAQKREEYEGAKASVDIARALLESVKDIPAGLDQCWEMLHGADHALKEGRLEEADAEAKNCVERTETALEGFFGLKMDEVNAAVEEALQSGVRSADLDFTGEVLDSLANKEYRQGWDQLVNGTQRLQELKKEYSEAREALEKATNMVYEAEEEVDLSAALEFIDQANGALESGDYPETKAMAERATEELWRSVKHYLRGQLTTTELLIRKLELGGKVKLKEAESIHAEAMTALDKDKLDETRVLLKKVVKEAKRARTNYEIIVRVISALEEIFTTHPINLHVLKKGRERAKEAFDKDYERVFDGDEEAPTVPMAAQLILQYQVKFEESITIDIDVSKAQGMLDGAKTALGNNDYVEAVRLVKECYDTVRVSEKMATIRTLISMEEIVLELKDGGLDTSIQEGLLERAREAVNEGNTGMAFKYMHETNESLLTMKEDHKTTLEAIRHAEIAMFIAAHMGIDTQLASDLLASARTMILENDFESAKDMTRQGHDEVLRAKSELLVGRQESVSGVINEAEEAGVPVHKAKHLLGKSRELLDAGDHLRAHSYVDKAEQRALHMRDMHGQIKELVDATNDKIEYARTLGVDIGEITRLQQMMNKVIATGKHEKVKELTTEIEGELLTKIISLCNKAITDCQDRLREAETMGLMVEDLRTEIDAASVALEEEEFDTVMDKTSQLNGAIDSLMATEIMSRLDRLRTSIEEADRLDISIPKAEERLSEASEAIDAADHKKAQEIMSGLSKEIRAERKKRIETYVKSSKAMIKAGEKQRLDVYGAKGLLDEASDALEREDIEEAFDLAIQAYNTIKEINLNHINEILTSSRAIVEMAKETGGDPGRVEGILTKTEELVTKDNFDRALFYAKQCAREADRLQFKIVQGMIAKIESDIKDAPEKDFSIAKGLLEQARSSLLTKKYDLAREKILECRDEVKRVFETPEAEAEHEAPTEPALAALETEATEKVAAAEGMLEQLAMAGLDTSEIQPAFDEALKAMGEGDFVAAIDGAEVVLEKGAEMKAGQDEAQSPTEEPEEEPAPATDPELERKAVGVIEAAEDMLLDVKGAGLVADRPEATLTMARKALEGRDFQTAIDLARRSLDESNAILSGEEPPPAPEPAPGPAGPEKAEAIPDGLRGLLESVNGNIEDAAKIGIQADALKGQFDEASKAIDEGRYDDADGLLRQVDARLADLLKGFKDLGDLITNVDNLMTMAASYSFDISQAQGLYQQGVGLRGIDPAKAANTLEQAKASVLKLLEGVYPYLTVDMAKDRPLVAGIWNESFVYISNTGNIHASNLSLEVLGAEVAGELAVARINIGETKEMKVKLKPAGAGKQTYKLRVTFMRDFDGRAYVAEFPQTITVNPTG